MIPGFHSRNDADPYRVYPHKRNAAASPDSSGSGGKGGWRQNEDSNGDNDRSTSSGFSDMKTWFVTTWGGVVNDLQSMANDFTACCSQQRESAPSEFKTTSLDKSKQPRTPGAARRSTWPGRHPELFDTASQASSTSVSASASTSPFDDNSLDGMENEGCYGSEDDDERFLDLLKAEMEQDCSHVVSKAVYPPRENQRPTLARLNKLGSGQSVASSFHDVHEVKETDSTGSSSTVMLTHRQRNKQVNQVESDLMDRVQIARLSESSLELAQAYEALAIYLYKTQGRPSKACEAFHKAWKLYQDAREEDAEASLLSQACPCMIEARQHASALAMAERRAELLREADPIASNEASLWARELRQATSQEAYWLQTHDRAYF